MLYFQCHSQADADRWEPSRAAIADQASFASPSSRTSFRNCFSASAVQRGGTSGLLVGAAGGPPDIRATHAALDGGGPISHYVLAWMTSEAVTLQPTDLYPAPPAGAKLAIREHYARCGVRCVPFGGRSD